MVHSFDINGDRFTAVEYEFSNSEVGRIVVNLVSFRLVCTNGFVSEVDVSASYRHVSTRFSSNSAGVG